MPASPTTQSYIQLWYDPYRSKTTQKKWFRPFALRWGFVPNINIKLIGWIWIAYTNINIDHIGYLTSQNLHKKRSFKQSSNLRWSEVTKKNRQPHPTTFPTTSNQVIRFPPSSPSGPTAAQQTAQQLAAMPVVEVSRLMTERLAEQPAFKGVEAKSWIRSHVVH